MLHRPLNNSLELFLSKGGYTQTSLKCDIFKSKNQMQNLQSTTFTSFNPPISFQVTLGISRVMPFVILGSTRDLAFFQSSIIKLKSLTSFFAFEDLLTAELTASLHKARKSDPTYPLHDEAIDSKSHEF